ncbi:DUF1684 domain-containing protein [Persicobacter diffluens]|uniref:DUF1684 domain-containing protein n=1 Tax=Persicobacter diffluens TaxID=981 RepID=A0AAN4W106_9BACT|nr:hypothetical protein PEDI_24770 [Persicobacter diffluens]
MAKKIALIVFSVIFIGIIVYSFQTDDKQNQPETYLASISEHRSKQNDFFKNSEQSPLTEEQKKSFQHLDYFPAQTDFCLQAKVNRTFSNETIAVQTSSGKAKTYFPYAYLEFEIQKQPFKLLALQPTAHPDMLLVAFTDNTTGHETYGAGRYIEIPLPKEDLITLDFNKAFNPYCAYSDGWSCPIPPLENHLNIPVTAGEKAFQKTL